MLVSRLCSIASVRRLCMKHISEAMDRMNLEEGKKRDDDMSIVEKIIHKTSDPKIAAILALDLLLVGVDTVSWPQRL